MQTSGIYKIISPSGKIYIGSSKNINQRIKNYKNIKFVKRQRRVYNSFLKYGVENHIFEIVCYCEYDELYRLENYYGLYFDVCGKNGLNCVIPRSGDIKGKVSLETIEKLRINGGHNKGSKRTPEQNEANRQRNLGRKASEATKLKMSKTRKGKVFSLETRQRISASNKGKYVSEETKEKLRIVNLGKKYSDDTKKKLSIAGKNKSVESKYKQLLNCPTRKEIIQYDLNMNFVAEHFSLKQLCRDLKGFYYNGVTNCLRNKTKKYKGFIWKYKENDLKK